MEDLDDKTCGGKPLVQTKLKIEFKTPIMTLPTYIRWVNISHFCLRITKSIFRLVCAVELIPR